MKAERIIDWDGRSIIVRPVSMEGNMCLRVVDAQSSATVEMRPEHISQLAEALSEYVPVDPAAFPVIEGVDVTGKYILRQSAGHGSIGDTEIEISGTTGLGGFALIVAVTAPGREAVYVEYDGNPIVEAVARAVLARAEA